MDDLTTHTSRSPIRSGFAPGFVIYKKGCTRLAAASDEAYQLLAHGRWFSPGTPASSTTKTDRHDIVEILLKVVLNTINQIKSSQIVLFLLTIILSVLLFVIFKIFLQGTLLQRKYKSKMEDETLRFIRQKRPRLQCKRRNAEDAGKYALILG